MFVSVSLIVGLDFFNSNVGVRSRLASVCGAPLRVESRKAAGHSICHGRTERLAVVVDGAATAVVSHAMSKASSPSTATGDRGKSELI